MFYAFDKKARNKFLQWLQLLAIQSAVVIGIYASLLILFFVPMFLAAAYSFLNIDFSASAQPLSWELVTHFLIIITIITTAFSIAFCPFISLIFYWRASNRLGQQIVMDKNKRVFFIRLGYSLTYFIVLGVASYQTSLTPFYQLLETYRAQKTFEGRSQIAAKILKDEKNLKKKLTNNYLAHYRYLTDQHMDFIRSFYIEQFKFDELAADNIQKAFIFLASPFVYQDNFSETAGKANQDYEDIFDEPIQLGEGKRVNQILRSSFAFDDQLKSSVLDRERKDVHLTKRTILTQSDINEQFALVTIEEEYENMTRSEQEVYYLFSLPQDSVVVDLKLGPDLAADKFPLELTNNYALPSQLESTVAGQTQEKDSTDLKVDQGEVAAKGAAQKTYEAQYRRRIDPAIIEQVGPVQYKLRVYPIPVAEASLNDWQTQKMQFSYIAPIRSDGSVQLPAIGEQRNIYYDNKTQLAGLSANVKNNSVVAVNRSQPMCSSKGSQFKVEGENGTVLYFIPHSANPWLADAELAYDCQQEDFAGAEEHLSGQRIALLADSSHTMGIKDWQTYLNSQLPLSSIVEQNSVDLYFFNDLVSEAINLNSMSTQFDWKRLKQPAFGRTDRLQVLEKIAKKYDLVIMFTDGSDADRISVGQTKIELAQPIYLVFKNGMAPALSDNLSTYLQANGARVVDSGTQAIQNYVVYKTIRDQIGSEDYILVGEAGTWLNLPSDRSDFGLLNDRFDLIEPTPFQAKIFLHRLIESQMWTAADDLDQLATLDQFNSLASQNSIVTPYSSLIVLVTDEQKEQLRIASLADDRFLVNHDLGTEALVEPSSAGLLGGSGVPEPHEWLLIIVGGGMIVFLGRQQILALVRRQHHA